MHYVLNVSKRFICHQGKEQECNSYIRNAQYMEVSDDLMAVMSATTKRRICVGDGCVRHAFNDTDNLTLIIVIGQMNRGTGD